MGPLHASRTVFYVYCRPFGGQDKKWPEVYNYHPFYNSILLPVLLLFLFLPALNINSFFKAISPSCKLKAKTALHELYMPVQPVHPGGFGLKA